MCDDIETIVRINVVPSPILALTVVVLTVLSLVVQLQAPFLITPSEAEVIDSWDFSQKMELELTLRIMRLDLLSSDLKKLSKGKIRHTDNSDTWVSSSFNELFLGFTKTIRTIGNNFLDHFPDSPFFYGFTNSLLSSSFPSRVGLCPRISNLEATSLRSHVFLNFS